MPVPTTPQVTSEKPTKETQPPPTSEASTTSSNDPCVVAGYEDCLRETIRFLVHEEKLPEEHPLVSGLNFHLASDTAHKELLRVSDQLAKKLSEELRSTINEDESDSGVETSSVSDEEESAPVKAYRLTLQEDDDDDDDDEIEEMDDEDAVYYMDESSDDEGGDDIITAKDILSHPYLRNELIKLVFQGCDLVASPAASL